jgi:hypothetical protein
VRLVDWPRSPYLNDEVREWVSLHLAALGVEEVAVFAVALGRQDEERRVLVATEIGLLDAWYAPRDSTARYALDLRLHPWQTVRGVELEGHTFRLWAREHESHWRLRIARPSIEVSADEPELGRALAQFAAACAVMADPAGQGETEAATPPTPARRAVSIDAAPEPEPIADGLIGATDDDPLGLRGPLRRSSPR